MSEEQESNIEEKQIEKSSFDSGKNDDQRSTLRKTENNGDTTTEEIEEGFVIIHSRGKSDEDLHKMSSCIEEEDKLSPHYPLLKIYRSLIRFVQQEAFDKEMRQELNTAVTCYLNKLERRMEDLKKLDCGITITGDTSSGKTSLINKILQQKVCRPRHRAATSTICRYHNSDEMAMQIVYKSGKVAPRESFVKTEDLRSKLGIISDVKMGPKRDIKYVDVFFPIPILQGNLMFVDTPGIGETEELTSKLIEYLSESISFIFLIDVSHHGGVTKDRLPLILSKVLENCDLMPCFDPEDVIFVTNKWRVFKTISDDDDDDEEDEALECWNDLVEKLQVVWPTLNVKHIFKLNLEQIRPKDETEEEKAEFNRFRSTLFELIERNKSKRVRRHVSLLKNFLENVDRVISSRVRLADETDENHIKDLENQQEELKRSLEECKKSISKLDQHIEETASKMAQKLHSFLNSDEGKTLILNPPGESTISSCPMMGLNGEISTRIQTGIANWLRDKDMKKAKNEIEEEIFRGFEGINRNIVNAYLSLTGKESQNNLWTVFKYTVSAPVWLPLVVGGGLLAIIGTILVLPVAIGMEIFSSEEQKIKKISACYSSQLESYSKEELEKIILLTLKKHFEKRILVAFTILIPRQIKSTLLTFAYVLDRKSYILKHKMVYKRMNKELEEMKKNVEKIDNKN